MDSVLERSRQARQHHTHLRQQISQKQLTIPALLAQALFNADTASMPVRLALSAIPRLSAARVAELMAEAEIPRTRRVGWLAKHPEQAQRLIALTETALAPRQPRSLPNPNWPWFGGI